ncbi:hypothetical protein ACHAPF_009944 [Botrytis cinerea]
MLLFVKACNVVANRSAVNLVYLEKKEHPASQKEQSAVRVGVASGIVVVDTSVTLTVSGNPHANSERVSATTELAWAKPKSGARPWESAVQYLNGASLYRAGRCVVHVLVVLDAKHSVHALVVVNPVSIFELAGGNMAVLAGIGGEDSGVGTTLTDTLREIFTLFHEALHFSYADRFLAGREERFKPPLLSSSTLVANHRSFSAKMKRKNLENYVFFAAAIWYGQHGLDFSSGKMARAMFKDNLSQHHKERIRSSHFKRSIIELDWLKSEQIIENAVMSIN